MNLERNGLDIGRHTGKEMKTYQMQVSDNKYILSYTHTIYTNTIHTNTIL